MFAFFFKSIVSKMNLSTKRLRFILKTYFFFVFLVFTNSLIADQCVFFFFYKA